MPWRRERSCIAGNRTRAVHPVVIPTERSRLQISGSPAKIFPVAALEIWRGKIKRFWKKIVINLECNANRKENVIIFTAAR
jgi:hypothetical protein